MDQVMRVSIAYWTLEYRYLLSSWCCDCSDRTVIRALDEEILQALKWFTFLHCLTVRWWSQSFFIILDLVSAVEHTTAYSESYFIWWTRLRCFWCWHHRACWKKKSEFLHFVLSFSIDQCRWLRSGSLVVFAVSGYWGGRMSHGCRMHRVCRIKWVICSSNRWSSQKGRFLWRLTFQLQRIHSRRHWRSHSSSYSWLR